MKKLSNTEQKATIVYYSVCVDKDAKDREICDHKHEVDRIDIMIPFYLDGQIYYRELSLTANCIKGLYGEIIEIESVIFKEEKATLPF